jgi:Ca2+-binding EF-hand superfamily protein
MSRTALPGFTDQQLRTFRKEFTVCDSRRAGRLTAAEFQTALTHLGVLPTQEEFTAMLAEVKSREIDLSNFLTLLYYFVRGADKPEELARALTVFDDDRDGKLSVEVVRDILGGLRRPVPEERISAIIEAQGENGLVAISGLIRELRPN